jgi:hypothetical protein
LRKRSGWDHAEATVLAAARWQHGMGAGPSAVLALCGGGVVEDLCRGLLDDPAIGLQRVEQVPEPDTFGPSVTAITAITAITAATVAGNPASAGSSRSSAASARATRASSWVMPVNFQRRRAGAPAARLVPGTEVDCQVVVADRDVAGAGAGVEQPQRGPFQVRRRRVGEL